MFFFFKQKTAYDMRISDWSSDVCSSDLVVFDVLARLLRHRYGEGALVYARNVTDVDDKINAAAAAEGVDISVVTARYEKHYLDDMAALGVAPPDVAPRATAHIDEMIAMIGRLIEGGHAYAAEGHALFHVPRSEEHTSELQSLMRNSYAVFCLK